jgi:protein SDA1
MKEACLSDNEKVVVGGVRFFLGGDKEREEAQDDSSDDDVDVKKIKHQIEINKKSKKRAKAVEKALDKVKRCVRESSIVFDRRFMRTEYTNIFWCLGKSGRSRRLIP